MSKASLIEVNEAIKAELSSKTKDEQKKFADLVARSILESDLYLFAHALGYTKVDLQVHDSVFQVLNSKARRKLIVIPRGCFKSTLGSVVYPIWRHLRNPDMRIIIDSELLTNSSKFIREIEGHLVGNLLTDLYGELKTSRTWNSTEIITSLRRDHSKKEASFTASGVGAQKTSQHYDLACLDDLSTPKNITTPEQREKVINHYKYYTSLLDPDHGELLVIGTRYHEGDLIGHIIENELDEDQRKALGF